MKKPIKKIIFFIIGISIIACDNDKYPEAPVKLNASFKLDIQPILTQECASCHNHTEVDPDLRDGYAYVSLMNLPEGSIVKGQADSSELVLMLHGGGDNPMPPGATISPAKIALIEQWIKEGALNN